MQTLQLMNSCGPLNSLPLHPLTDKEPDPQRAQGHTAFVRQRGQPCPLPVLPHLAAHQNHLGLFWTRSLPPSPTPSSALSPLARGNGAGWGWPAELTSSAPA